MDVDHKLDTQGWVVGGGLAGLTALTLNQWVAIATLVYFLIQIVISMPKLIFTLHTIWNKYVRK